MDRCSIHTLAAKNLILVPTFTTLAPANSIRKMVRDANMKQCEILKRCFITINMTSGTCAW